jgi:putative FmdB family regulatory protein
MPTYEYECTKCDHRFEAFQSMKDEPLKRCPKCRCKIRRALGSGAGIIFRGTGFYETDYKRKGYHEAAKKESAAAASAAGGGTKSDTPSKTEKKAKD